MTTQNENSSPPKVLKKETDFTLPSEYDDLKSNKMVPTDDESTSKDSDDTPPPSVTPAISKSTKQTEKPKSATKKIKKAAPETEEKESKVDTPTKGADETPKPKKRAAKISESSSGKGQSTPATSAKKRRTKKDQED